MATKKKSDKSKKGYKREYYEDDCPVCQGSGLVDYEHGLIRLHCTRCKGTGKIRRERRILKGEESASIETFHASFDNPEEREEKASDDAGGGTGSAISGGAGQTTGESPVPEESKAG